MKGKDSLSKAIVPRSRERERMSTGRVRVIGKDHLSRERRSWNMSRIRGKNTKPEMIVRSMLHKMGYRFRLHVRIPLPELKTKNSKLKTRKRAVSVDIVLPKYKRRFLFVEPHRDIINHLATWKLFNFRNRQQWN